MSWVEWRCCPGFEGLYEVSDAGNLRNARTLYVLKPRYDKDGYEMYTLWKGEPVRAYTVKGHRLIAEAFLGAAPPGRPLVNHKNSRRADNRVSNLEWADHQENNAHLRFRSRGNATGFRGVRYRDRVRPWQAYGSVGGRFKSLGHYETAKEAVEARLAFERRFLK